MILQASAEIFPKGPLLEEIRQVAFADEHEEVQLPDELLIQDGKVDLYDEILAKGLFKIIVKGRKLVLSAGSYVGLIPINDRLAVEVRTRVPVANLERMLNMVAKVDAKTLPLRTGYAVAAEQPASVLDLITDDLLDAVEGLRLEGLPKGYERVRQTGTRISGAISIKETAVQRVRTGLPCAVYQSFQRSANTQVNRLLRDAIVLLIEIYGSTRNRVGNRRRLTQLSSALNLFELVAPSARSTMRHPVDPDNCANNRPQLYRATRMANLIVQNHGISIRKRGGEDLPTFLVSMDLLFEDYVRTLLRHGMKERAGTQILDGNQPPPQGGKSVFFKRDGGGALGNKPITPDILIQVDHVCQVIIETKYKPCKELPSREELSQVLTYGTAYACPKLVLAYPSLTGSTDIQFLGQIGGFEFFKATVDMGSQDIETSENLFVEKIAELMRLPS